MKMAIKLDMKMAYDEIDWDYLKAILYNSSFPKKKR